MVIKVCRQVSSLTIDWNVDMDSEDNVEVGSTFHKNLIGSENQKGDLVEEDRNTIRDYHDYVCYKRKRAALIGLVGILVTAALIFTVVYFAHIKPNADKGHIGDCEQNQEKFQPVDNKCFKYRDVQTREIMFKGHAKECMDQCLTTTSCLSVDFYKDDGECWLFSVTSEQVLLEWTDEQEMRQLDVKQRRKLHNCMHYDRKCL